MSIDTWFTERAGPAARPVCLSAWQIGEEEYCEAFSALLGGTPVCWSGIRAATLFRQDTRGSMHGLPRTRRCSTLSKAAARHTRFTL